jgi:hypothetical protein
VSLWLTDDLEPPRVAELGNGSIRSILLGLTMQVIAQKCDLGTLVTKIVAYFSI